VNLSLVHRSPDVDAREVGWLTWNPSLAWPSVFFCASDIRFLASALMRRRLGDREASAVAVMADVFFGGLPPSKAAIDLSMRPLSAFQESDDSFSVQSHLLRS